MERQELGSPLGFYSLTNKCFYMTNRSVFILLERVIFPARLSVDVAFHHPENLCKALALFSERGR